jgi:hypothetical protein
MILDNSHPAPPAGPAEASSKATGGRLGLWESARAGLGTLLGLVPHVMHHIGLIAGAALLTGAVGNSVLYGVGLVLSIPLLRRLRRRFNTWKAPILGVAVFTVLFGVSTFLLSDPWSILPVRSRRFQSRPANIPATIREPCGLCIRRPPPVGEGLTKL